MLLVMDYLFCRGNHLKLVGRSGGPFYDQGAWMFFIANYFYLWVLLSVPLSNFEVRFSAHRQFVYFLMAASFALGWLLYRFRYAGPENASRIMARFLSVNNAMSGFWWFFDLPLWFSGIVYAVAAIFHPKTVILISSFHYAISYILVQKMFYTGK